MENFKLLINIIQINRVMLVLNLNHEIFLQPMMTEIHVR